MIPARRCAIKMISEDRREASMPDILVRGLDRATIERLKRRARGRGRSLQSEVKAIIEQTSAVDMESALAMADAIRERFRGRRFPDSAGTVRRDRDR